MDEKLIRKIKTELKTLGVPIVGAAKAGALDQKAPESFRPSDMLAGARTVLVFAKPLPLAVFLTDPQYKNAFYTRSFATYYEIMDRAANEVSLILEQAGYPSLPVPSYSPLRFVNGEVRGLLSLKHAAVEAGIGKMGKNTLLLHPDHGNILRLGGMVTTAPWDWDEPKEFPKLCPKSCTKCQEACPVGALTGEGIDKSLCMANCINHVLMPPSRLMPGMKKILSKSTGVTRLMESLTFNLFQDYGIDCMACLQACIHFPGRKLSHLEPAG